MFGFFLLQAVFYAVTIDYGIPPDETYHFESIKYYGDRPISSGPFLKNQSPDTIQNVNNIDRNPKYLYHYLASFPQRAAEAAGASEDTQILIMRIISIILAFCSLLVLKKIFDQLTPDRLIKNIALAAYILTGMFVWLAGSINYDNLANLFFLIFVLLMIRFIRRPGLVWFLAVMAAGMATVLTKHSFLPMLILGFAVGVYYLVKTGRWRTNIFKKANLKTWAVIVVFCLTSVLFFERIGGNLVHYGALYPKCNKFFTDDQCGVYRVTARDYQQKSEYTPEAKHAVVRDWDPFTHTGTWIYKMYDSLPWYLGHQRIESNIYSEISAALLAVLFFVTMLFPRRKAKKIRAEYKFVIAATITYFGVLYLFNLNTYFNIGQMNAYQGRYLLPVLGFFYLFVVTLALSTYRNMSGSTKKLFGYLWLITAAVYVGMHFTPLLFYIGSDSSWFDNIPPDYYS